VEDAAHRVHGAVRRLHVDADLAVRPRVDLTDRVGEAMRAPPCGEMFRIGEHAEHERARRREDTGNLDLTGRDGFHLGLDVHGVFLFGFNQWIT
jgi:hypothetical protein